MWKKMTVLCLAAAALIVFTGTVADAADTIGVVDWQALGPQHKDFANASRQLEQIAAQKRKEAMEAADKETDPAKKNEIQRAKLEELAKEEQKLLTPIIEACDRAIRTIAAKRKLTVVLDKVFVRLGGVDITPDVIQEMNR